VPSSLLLVEASPATSCGRRTAKQAGDGRVSTGRALAPRTGLRADPFNLAMSGESAGQWTVAELVGDGIYVTRLHYLGVVDPGIITGDAARTFRIEGR
jgi:hypothetical protein